MSGANDSWLIPKAKQISCNWIKSILSLIVLVFYFMRLPVCNSDDSSRWENIAYIHCNPLSVQASFFKWFMEHRYWCSWKEKQTGTHSSSPSAATLTLLTVLLAHAVFLHWLITNSLQIWVGANWRHCFTEHVYLYAEYKKVLSMEIFVVYG